MVQAWYMDEDLNNPQLSHQQKPPQNVTLEDLYTITGVEYFKLNLDTYTTDGILADIRERRGYTFEDEITCSKECLPNFEACLKKFFEEHLHTDEEIRLVLEGAGYFDVRDRDDKWIRIHVVAGDMIVIPSGIYHRFTMDENMYIKAKRFFIGEPVWLPYNRPADEMECRGEYLKKLDVGFESK